MPPKSREYDKDIWSVVRLRFGPVAKSLNSLVDLPEGQNSHFTHHQMYHLYTIALSTLKMFTHMAHVNRSRDTHHLLLIGPIKHHLDTLTLLLSLLDINLGQNAHASLCDWTYLKMILHYGCHWLMAICPRILHMEYSSHSTTVLDRRSCSCNAWQHHWKGLHNLLLQ